ncbi:MAG: hypothetical protein H5T86_06010 [Armatimonadetes bacterium]|nr:hypothetical protein [Armatimonadota bacterium]
MWAPERAARIPWIGRILLGPDEVRWTKYRGVNVFVAIRQMPGGQPYGVFLTVSGPGEADFSSAYPLDWKTIQELRKHRPVYRKKTSPARARHWAFSCGRPAAGAPEKLRRRP